MQINTNSRIFVAGHRGMVGSALVRNLRSRGYHNLVLVTREELDLREESLVQDFFAKQKPEYVLLSAAKVGGILANYTYPADFISDNLRIQNSVLQAAKHTQVKRLIFLGSSCIYPKEAPQPISESALLTGALEPTNSAYAIAKIAGIEMCRSYNKQYGTQFLGVMPTNLYGINDNYHPENSHVLPGLIRRIHEAKQQKLAEVEIWGDGSPLREFLYADDLAEACLFLLFLPEKPYQDILETHYYPIINIGSGEEISIKNLALLIKKIIGYPGTCAFNTAKPNGTMRKILNSSLIRSLDWMPKINLEHGIQYSYQDFLKRYT